MITPGQQNSQGRFNTVISLLIYSRPVTDLTQQPPGLSGHLTGGRSRGPGEQPNQAPA